jgi:hypothetical protein
MTEEQLLSTNEAWQEIVVTFESVMLCRKPSLPSLY